MTGKLFEAVFMAKDKCVSLLKCSSSFWTTKLFSSAIKVNTVKLWIVFWQQCYFLPSSEITLLARYIFNTFCLFVKYILWSTESFRTQNCSFAIGKSAMRQMPSNRGTSIVLKKNFIANSSVGVFLHMCVGVRDDAKSIKHFGLDPKYCLTSSVSPRELWIAVFSKTSPPCYMESCFWNCREFQKWFERPAV